MEPTAYYAGQTIDGEDVFVRRQVAQSWSEPGWWIVTRRSADHASVWSPSAGWSLPGDDAPADTHFDSAYDAMVASRDARIRGGK
jgi:hypothetical protein